MINLISLILVIFGVCVIGNFDKKSQGKEPSALLVNNLTGILLIIIGAACAIYGITMK